MRTALATVMTLALAAPAAAQQDRTQQRTATITGGLEIGIPTGEFDASWGRQMAGLSANMTLPMRRLPFSYGFDFAWQRMGGGTRKVTVDDPVVTSREGEMKVRSNLYGYHGMLRFQPYRGKVSPYLDGMLGLRHFLTTTEVNVKGLDQPILEERNESAFVGSAGFAIGAYYEVTRHFVLEARFERLSGGRVTYVDPRSIEITQAGEVTYGTLSSGSRMVNLTFGAGFRF